MDKTRLFNASYAVTRRSFAISVVNNLKLF